MEFFVTCGSGLEGFAIRELNEKFNISIDSESSEEQCIGKIFFRSTCGGEVNKKFLNDLIVNLKSIERLFGIVYVTEQSIPSSLRSKSSKELLNYLYEITTRLEVKEKLLRWKFLKGNEDISIRNIDLVDEDVSSSSSSSSSSPIKMARFEDNITQSYTFRVNVKATGTFRHRFDPRLVSKSIGSGIVKNLSTNNWKIDLKHPNLELSVYITDQRIIFAVSLTQKPISERSYLVHIPLRSTVAYSMSSLLFRYKPTTETEIETKAETETETDHPLLVLDPMCGTGTILIELGLNFKRKFLDLIGMDIDLDQLSKAKENICQAKLEGQVSLVHHDAKKKFGLKEGLVDSIICDLPFGQQHGKTEDEVKINLPKIFKSMDSILKGNGILVFLMSTVLSDYLENLAIENIGWKLLDKFPLKLGELQAKIFVFQKPCSILVSSNISTISN